MAKIKLILASRLNKQGLAQIKIMVSHNSVSAYLSTGVEVSPDEWIVDKVVGRSDAKRLNRIIDGLFLHAKAKLQELRLTQDIDRFTAQQLRDMLSPDYDPDEVKAKKRKDNLFVPIFNQYNETHTNAHTRDLYARTMKALIEFDSKLDCQAFEDIDGAYINKFKESRKGKDSPNTISIYLCHIRAVFNYAIYDLEITHHYPFRKRHGINKVTLEQTQSKVQPMPLEHLREILNAEHCEPWQQKWIDLAKLVFYLIGINMADLAELKEIDQFGYITYRRRKTRDRSKNGALYRIKVEPEAIEIINRWPSVEHLLNHFDGREHYQSANKQMVHAVKCFGIATPPSVGGAGNKATISRKSKDQVSRASRYGYFCLYSLRKAWATIAFNHCNIPMEVISMALGHSDGRGMSVTQRYVQMSNRLVDEANRAVIDFVLYGKMP